MAVEVRFFATFREAVGSKSLSREISPGTPVGEVLEALMEEYPELDLYDDGELRGYINVMVNGRNIMHEDGEATRLEPGDEISIFPPVEGGIACGLPRRLIFVLANG